MRRSLCEAGRRDRIDQLGFEGDMNLRSRNLYALWRGHYGYGVEGWVVLSGGKLESSKGSTPSGSKISLIVTWS